MRVAETRIGAGRLRLALTLSVIAVAALLCQILGRRKGGIEVLKKQTPLYVRLRVCGVEEEWETEYSST